MAIRMRDTLRVADPCRGAAGRLPVSLVRVLSRNQARRIESPPAMARPQLGALRQAGCRPSGGHHRCLAPPRWSNRRTSRRRVDCAFRQRWPGHQNAPAIGAPRHSFSVAVMKAMALAVSVVLSLIAFKIFLLHFPCDPQSEPFRAGMQIALGACQ